MNTQTLLTAELQTLLEGKSLHVLLLGPHKIIFAFNRNIGFIDGDKIIIKDEFKEGGRSWNAILPEMLNLVKETYQIKEGVTTQTEIDATNSDMDKLNEILQKITTEKDKTKASALADQADDIATRIGNKAAADINNKILDIYLKLDQPGDDSAEETKPVVIDDETIRNSLSEYMTVARAGIMELTKDKEERSLAEKRIALVVETAAGLSGDALLKYYNALNLLSGFKGVSMFLEDHKDLFQLKEEKKPASRRKAAPAKASKKAASKGSTKRKRK
jgi:hypothetical protein